MYRSGIRQFDRQVETTSGKDTLHDTVGIAYQNVCPDLASTNPNTENCDHFDFTIERKKHKTKNNLPINKGRENKTESITSATVKGVKRRRTYEANNQEIEPY